MLEKADKVGGIARTETRRGYRFDIGGHRFFTKVEEAQRLSEDMHRKHVDVIQRFLASLDNVQRVGRNGLH